MYGSSRLGLIRRNLDADQPRLTAESITNLGNGYLANFTRGGKLFELTNHLGNVAVVVSDRVLPTVSGVPTTIRDFTAEVITASDFYAFGSNTRTYNAPWHSYRYGFNGKEVDNEMFGLSNELDYGMRVYDPRVGRFLSVDPITNKYPWYTPYSYAGNKPIWATDLDGLEENTTSTYVYRPPVLSLKPTFDGIITITNASGKAVHKIFEGSYSQMKARDKTGLDGSIVYQIADDHISSALSLDLQINGVRKEIVKSWKSTDIKYFQQYSYNFTYLDENQDPVTEEGKFEVNIYDQKGTSIYAPATILVTNKVLSAISTRVANGVSLLKNVKITGLEVENQRISKLLRWGDVRGGNYEATAEMTRNFTRKIGNKAIEELKSLGYTKDDFVKWKKTYETAVDNLKQRGKNIEVQQSRLESVNKIIELWK